MRILTNNERKLTPLGAAIIGTVVILPWAAGKPFTPSESSPQPPAQKTMTAEEGKQPATESSGRYYDECMLAFTDAMNNPTPIGYRLEGKPLLWVASSKTPDISYLAGAFQVHIVPRNGAADWWRPSTFLCAYNLYGGRSGYEKTFISIRFLEYSIPNFDEIIP